VARRALSADADGMALGRAPTTLTLTATRLDTSLCTLTLVWSDDSLDVRAW
jgi:hypothetical protein